MSEIKDGVVFFRPISPAAGWRHASTREIVGHWSRTGRRNTRASGGNEEELVAPREQLSLPGFHR
ncbi:MAG: hypothetical protein ABSG43_21935 [Solirubrobacteraceae bacterium]